MKIGSHVDDDLDRTTMLVTSPSDGNDHLEK